MIAWPLLLLALPAAPHEGLHEQLAELTRQIAQTPRDARLYLRRAELHRLHGAWPSALDDLDAAQRRAPELLEVERVRGHVWLETGELERAEAALDRLLSGRPDDLQGLELRAEVRERRSTFASAAADYERVLALDEHPGPGPYLGRARAAAAAGDPARALAGLDAGLERLGAVVSLELAAVDLEVQLERYDAALARLAAIESRSASRAAWLARRGDVLALAGRRPAARAAWRAALEELARSPREHRRTAAALELQASLRDRLAEADPEACP